MTKVAVIQMCSTTNVDENLINATSLIQQAAQQGAVLAVLPEMFALIGQTHCTKVAIKEMPGSGKIQDWLASTASKFNIWIVSGTIPIVGHNSNKIRAACIIFDNQGNQVARYDKMHMFDAALNAQEVYKESDTTEPGNKIVVVDTPAGKLGVCVCFDIRFPQIFEQLVAQQVEIIAIPAAFTVKTGAAHWEILARCRAIDTFCYVLGACQGGEHTNGRTTYGHSMIINPWGEIIEEIKIPGNAIVCADLNLKQLYEIRKQIPKSITPPTTKRTSN